MMRGYPEELLAGSVASFVDVDLVVGGLVELEEVCVDEAGVFVNELERAELFLGAPEYGHAHFGPDSGDDVGCVSGAYCSSGSR